MLFDRSQDSLNAWKNEMHQYQKGKRTKKPFGSATTDTMRVTHQQVKSKECLFNPVLQTFQRQEDQRRADQKNSEQRARSLVNHLKNSTRHQKDFDIVNLHSNFKYQPVEKEKKLGPVRNAYNVINNQKLPDFYFSKREMRLPAEKTKTILGGQHAKDFNIVTGEYKYDNEERVAKQMQMSAKNATDVYWRTHNFDSVFGKFYDSAKEEDFQRVRKEKEMEHGKDADNKLPPSYIYRQPFIADYTKPLPEALQVLDQQKANQQKKFQVKYMVLDEYAERNIEEDKRQAQVQKAHVHFGRVLDEKAKEFDIVTNKAYNPSRAEELYRKKVGVSWDQLMKEASQPVPKTAIKSGGFV